MQYYASTENSYVVEKNALDEQLHAVKERLVGHVAMVLNARMGSYSTLLGHVTERHRFGEDHKDYKRFVYFCIFYSTLLPTTRPVGF